MTIWILPIERHEQRYTGEWLDYLPAQIERAAAARGRDVQVVQIEGDAPPEPLTPGAFLNFAGTNVYKGTQIAEVARRFSAGEVRRGDTFLITDAWHPGVHQIRYMSALLKIPVRIIGMWHAGSYDPHDFLGGIPHADRAWVRSFERALFEAYDTSVFATEYHIDLFRKGLGLSDSDRRVVQAGWPMEYLADRIKPGAKEDIVLFPHRIAPEKQVDLFNDLSALIDNGWRFVVAQNDNLTKAEYHDLLARSRVVFSASLQETLGIGCYEGVLAGAVPLVPDRLSYREMYPKEFRYHSEWTQPGSHLTHQFALVERVKQVMDAAARGAVNLKPCREQLDPFFSGERLYSILLN